MVDRSKTRTTVPSRGKRRQPPVTIDLSAEDVSAGDIVPDDEDVVKTSPEIASKESDSDSDKTSDNATETAAPGSEEHADNQTEDVAASVDVSEGQVDDVTGNVGANSDAQQSDASSFNEADRSENGVQDQKSGRSFKILAFVSLLVILILGIGYLWFQMITPSASPAEASIAKFRAELKDEIASVTARQDALDQALAVADNSQEARQTGFDQLMVQVESLTKRSASIEERSVAKATLDDALERIDDGQDGFKTTLNGLDKQIELLANQIADLSAIPTPADGTADADDRTARQLNGLQITTKALRTDLSTIKKQFADLAERLDAFEAGTTQDRESLGKELAQVRESMASFSNSETSGDETRSILFQDGVLGLMEAAKSGAPFQRSLLLIASGDPDRDISLLRKDAERGLLSAASLSQNYQTLLPEETPSEDGVIGQIEQFFNGMVEIRRKDDPAPIVKDDVVDLLHQGLFADALDAAKKTKLEKSEELSTFLSDLDKRARQQDLIDSLVKEAGFDNS